MPKSHSAAAELAPLLDGSSAGELIPELVRHGLQQLIELEVAAVLGADRHQRSEERSGYRNGSRPRVLTTQVGDIDLRIPKLRSGSFLPLILEPRRRVDQALYAVVMEAYVAGVSTRKVDALVAALGSQSGISKSQVSRICADIDLQVQAFLSRPLDASGYAYLYLDATYLHGRLGRAMQVCSRAVVVAMGLVPAWGGWLFPLELGLGRGLLTTGRHLRQGHAGMGPDLLRNLATSHASGVGGDPS